jgi:hypothetical protein
MKRFFLTAIAIFLMVIPAFAQEQLGRIEGRVLTEDGKAIPNARVELTGSSLVAGQLVSITDERGRFRFQLLPVGSYNIKITADQYQTFEQSDITVNIGATVTLTPVLKIGAFEQVISITGEAPIIDVTSTAVGENFTQDIISKLPMPRFPYTAMTIAAGNVDGEYGSTLGGTQRSNAYMLDGIDISDPGTHTPWTFVNIESVEEMEVLPIAGATADIGNYTGAALNMVTKSGGNDFTGGVAYYFFNKDFITWNTDDPELRDTVIRDSGNNDFTGFFGGPILKDTAWFFGNVGWRKTKQLQAETELSREYRNSMWKFSTAFRGDMNAWFTYHYDNYLRKGRGADYNVAPEATVDQDGPSNSFSLHYAWVIDDNNLYEFKFNGFDGYFALYNNGEGANIYDVDNDWYYGGSGYDYRSDRQRISIDNHYTRYLEDIGGDHEIKMGLEWTRGQAIENDQWDYMEIYNGQWDYREAWEPDWYTKTQVKTWTFFITDGWSISDRLLVNVGLRYDRPTFFIPDQDRPDGEVLSGPGAVHHFNNVAPRIGFTYKLTEDGKTLLRGSWGRYYEGMMAYMLDEFVPNPTYFNQYYWDGEWVLYRSKPEGADPNDPASLDVYTLDPNLSGHYADAFTLGVEHELMEGIAIGADYMFRRYENFPVFMEDGIIYEQVQLTDDLGNTYTVYNDVGGSIHYTITNAPKDELYSKFNAVILRATKRYSDNWQLQASLTLSDLRGTAEDLDTTSESAVNAGLDYYLDPNNQINAVGMLSYHTPYNLKINGTYTLPYDISVSTIISYMSGFRYSPTVRLYGLNQGRITISAEPRGSRALDPKFNADLRVEKEFQLLDRFRLSLLFDIYNITNDGSAYWVQRRLDLVDTFGHATDLVQPRKFQVGFRINF